MLQQRPIHLYLTCWQDKCFGIFFLFWHLLHRQKIIKKSISLVILYTNYIILYILCIANITRDCLRVNVTESDAQKQREMDTTLLWVLKVTFSVSRNIVLIKGRKRGRYRGINRRYERFSLGFRVRTIPRSWDFVSWGKSLSVSNTCLRIKGKLHYGLQCISIQKLPKSVLKQLTKDENRSRQRFIIQNHVTQKKPQYIYDNI